MDKFIEYYLLLHGHDLKSISFKLDNQLGDYIDYVIKVDKQNRNVFPKTVDKKTIIKKCRSFLNKHFEIHDVGYINDNLVMDKVNGQEILSIEDAACLYNNACIKMSPFDLPIEFSDAKIMSGSLVVSTPIIDSKELLKIINIYFEGIKLNNNLTNLLVPIYVHEIVHTQLESNKGIVSDIKNKEILSIFLELLYTYKQNQYEYRFFLNERFKELMGNFNTVCKYAFRHKKADVAFAITLSYLVSTVKAFKLLDLYLNSSLFVKREIIKSIQNVFDGYDTLEEMLKDYEIEYENSLDPKILSRIVK